MNQDDLSDEGAPRPPAGIDLSDFEAIEGAVSETARGRWFLAEYARRLRAADTGRILEALNRLEARQALAEPGFDAGARHQARGIAERLSDIAWALRERGLPDDLCRLMQREAAAIGALGGAPMEQGAMLARDVTPPRIEAAAPHGAIWDLARLDSLSTEEKIRLFA